jgi:hypothetical protein
MLCSVIFDDVNYIIDDPNDVKYSLQQKIAAMNNALQALATYRPDAFIFTGPVALTEGTYQTLPTGGVRLVSISRNRGAAGIGAGRAIRLGDIDIKDAINPNWHTATAQSPVQEYFYNPLRPKEFFVSPPSPITPVGYVEATYVKEPIAITAKNDELPVDDLYSPALQEWILYKIFGGDDPQSVTYSEAKDHQATFFSLLQIKSASDIGVSAKPKGAQ